MYILLFQFRNKCYTILREHKSFWNINPEMQRELRQFTDYWVNKRFSLIRIDNCLSDTFNVIFCLKLMRCKCNLIWFVHFDKHNNRRKISTRWIKTSTIQETNKEVIMSVIFSVEKTSTLSLIYLWNIDKTLV